MNGAARTGADGGLAGAAAIVTGAASGIGRATAERPARAGASVCVNFHGHPEPADAVAAAVERLGGRAISVGARGRA